MCGIAGLWDSGHRWDQHGERLARASRALEHRGPDGEGTWFSSTGEVGLMHRRLAIIDLNPRAAQPMMSQKQASVVTFNGEIYNYAELKKDQSHDWSTTSDTEVVLEMMESLGPASLRHFDGMFAFAHYKIAEQEMFLAVDPFGKKPIYTYWDGQVFAFASEIKGLVAMGVKLEVCPDIFSEYLLFGSALDNLTVYKNIRRMEGGSCQRIVKGIPQKAQIYWDLPLGKIDQKISYSDAKVQLKELISLAVKKRLVSDVPVACFLSGGLDSSVVALEAQKLMGERPLSTFSKAFLGMKDFDESPYAAEVARKIRSHHVRLTGGDVTFEEQRRIMAHFDEPFPDSSLMPTYSLCRAVRANAKVALSGDGGDELFGGYRRMQAGLLTENHNALLKYLLRPLIFKPRSARGMRSRLGTLPRLREAVAFPLTRRQLQWNSYFPEGDLARHVPFNIEKVQRKLNHWEEILQGQDTGQKILYFALKTYLFSDLLPKADRMSMANSLEVRSPLLDRDLSEFVFSLPTSYKFTYRHSKRILKDAYRDELGTTIVDRRKQGFATPLTKTVAEWSQTSGHHMKDLKRQVSGDFTALLDSQASTSRYESCAFSLWAAQECFARLPS